jgi:hypothetical protein
MLMHYADMFHMNRFNLLVIDECHYATGNHAYAVIMKKFYHPTPVEDRPHVLGLTASPLVNVKETHTDEHLASMLSNLESTLDSTLASISGLGYGRGPGDENKNNVSGLLLKTAQERVVTYKGRKSGKTIPSAENLPLHSSRYREFCQLVELYKDLGPLVTSVYCRTVVRELSRNTYEKESAEEFSRATKHLDMIATYCEQECVLSPTHVSRLYTCIRTYGTFVSKTTNRSLFLHF